MAPLLDKMNNGAWSVCPGASIHDVLPEAHQIAKETGGIVMFVFNGLTLLIGPQSDIKMASRHYFKVMECGWGRGLLDPILQQGSL